MKKHVLTLLFVAFASLLQAQSVGDFTIHKKVNTTGPLTPKHWAGGNNKIWWTDGSGNPGNLDTGNGLKIESGALVFDTADFGAFGVSMLNAAADTDARTLLGLGTAALLNTTSSEGSGSLLSLGSHTHNLGGTQMTGTLPITKGGTGLVDTPTNGQLLIGNTLTNAWARATLTGGNGITITNGNASISIAVNLGTLSGTVPVANGGTGITSFGSGVATFLGTPSSANLATAVTGETGSGALMFATSPTITTSLALAGGAVTASTPILDMSQTWNNAAVNFKGLAYNVVDTAYNTSDSRLFEFSTTSQGARVWALANGHVSAARFAAIGTSSYLDANCNVAGSLIVESGFLAMNSAQNVWIKRGTGTPEGAQTASPGSLYIRTDGGAGTTFYVKETGTGNTGWVAK